MRMSCNGCRVLRKGCSDKCTIRPCLQWIKTPESQANATVFLAKFYGRAGLLNLINAGPEHLRPEVFRSLLYEACGRIVNPISGSVGLLWSGSWMLCHNAVEAVLNGAPITQLAPEVADFNNGPPLKAYDIRHVSKDEVSAGSSDLHRVRTRCRFKRSVVRPKATRASIHDDELNRSPSHQSSLSQQSEAAHHAEGESREPDCAGSADNNMVPGQVRPDPDSEPVVVGGSEDGEIELELTLGFDPITRTHGVNNPTQIHDSSRHGSSSMELGLDS